jgi:AraC-like DNA-binding protein
MSSTTVGLNVEWDFRTENLEACRAKVAGILKPFSLIGRPKTYYDARLTSRRLYHADMVVIDYGEEVRVDADVMKDFHLIQVPLRGAYCMSSKGHTSIVRRGEAHLIHDAMPLSMACSADLSLLVFKFDKHSFPSLCVEEARRRAPDHQRFGYILPFDGSKGRSLQRTIEFVAGETLDDGLTSRQPEARLHAEELLMAAISGALHDSSRPGAIKPAGDAMPYVRRAEDFIERHINDDLTLDDIITASRVSARTLFYGFQKTHGVGPWAWTRMRRLQGAHAALMSATARDTRITDIALEWGFGHLGRFSAGYRLQFGESPSDTLARSLRRFAAADR